MAGATPAAITIDAQPAAAATFVTNPRMSSSPLAGFGIRDSPEACAGSLTYVAAYACSGQDVDTSEPGVWLTCKILWKSGMGRSLALLHRECTMTAARESMRRRDLQFCTEIVCTSVSVATSRQQRNRIPGPPPKAASRPGRRSSGTRNPAERCLGHPVEIQMETLLIVLLLVLLLGGGGWYGRGHRYERRRLNSRSEQYANIIT